MEAQFDQTRLNSTLERYILSLESEVWPRAINKKGLFVSLGAAKRNPKNTYESLVAELMRPVNARSVSGSYERTKEVPVGFVIAAKRASSNWTSSNYSRQKAGKKELRLTVTRWRKAMAKKFKSMLGGRKRSLKFLDAGWFSVVRLLGPEIGGKYDRSGGAALRGSLKGDMVPAKKGSLVVTIINTAKAKSENRGGFDRIAGPPLVAAINAEMESMEKFMNGEMAPATNTFNRAQS